MSLEVRTSSQSGVSQQNASFDKNCPSQLVIFNGRKYGVVDLVIALQVASQQVDRLYNQNKETQMAFHTSQAMLQVSRAQVQAVEKELDLTKQSLDLTKETLKDMTDTLQTLSDSVHDTERELQRLKVGCKVHGTVKRNTPQRTNTM